MLIIFPFDPRSSSSDHIKELNNARPSRPFFFLKPPTSILPPSAGPILRPQGVTLHYEVELALIMGRTLTDLHPDDHTTAMDAIDGYAVAIDMTARNVQDECKRKGLPWTSAKGFDTFLPVSKFIEKGRIRDPHDVEMWLSVGEKQRQRDSTGLMLFRIPRLLSEISRVMKLEEGDIVCTGTPKGVGSVEVGDVMRAGVKVGGQEVEEGMIEVAVEEGRGSYIYKET